MHVRVFDQKIGFSVVCVCGKCLTSGCWRRAVPTGCSGVGFGWVALLVGSRIDCWHTHTDLDEVTDAGFKAFSAALGSSTSIATVNLTGESECLVRWVRVLLCMRVCLVGVSMWWYVVWCVGMGVSVVCLCGKCVTSGSWRRSAPAGC